MSEADPAERPRGFRGPEAIRYAGISYRQLDYWCRTGLVVPSVREAHGSGSQRLYSRADVVRLLTVRILVDAGLSLQKIRDNLDRLLWPSLGVFQFCASERVLVSASIGDLLAAIPDPTTPAAELPTLAVVR